MGELTSEPCRTWAECLRKPKDNRVSSCVFFDRCMGRLPDTEVTVTYPGEFGKWLDKHHPKK